MLELIKTFVKIETQALPARYQYSNQRTILLKLSRPSERKYVMSQILTLYSKELAEIRNNSFNAFFSKIKEPAAV